MAKHNTQLIISILSTFIIALGFTSPQQDEAVPLKVMTYNIWNGFDWGKDVNRRTACVQWIKSQQPDVLALQELCGYTETMLKEDAKKWGHDYVKLLKTEGYPTGLTSNKPIELIEKVVKPFWHGMLHCKTYGIDFFVVHFSPADCEFRLKEAQLVTERIRAITNEQYVILGDFNSHSPIDARRMEQNEHLKRKYTPKDNKSKYSNLRLGEFDYSAMAQMLAAPAIDVCLDRIDLKRGFTFPAPALIGKYNHTSKTIKRNRERIDYILASPALAQRCEEVKVFNQKETQGLSDHFPLMATFQLANQ